MKGKIPKILSVGLALVLVLSFSLVMAVPVGATHTSSATVGFATGESNVTGTENVILDVEVTNDAASADGIKTVKIDFTDSDFTVTGAGATPDGWGAPSLDGDVVTCTKTTGGMAPGASVTISPVVTNPATAGDAVVPEVLTTDAGTEASLDAALDTGWIGYVADSVGVGGNNITVEYRDPGFPNKDLSVSVAGTAITVSLKTVDSVLTSTASEVAAAIQADGGDGGAAELVDATADGGHLTYVVQALTVPAFTGGTSPDVDKDCPVTPGTLTVIGPKPTVTNVQPDSGNVDETMWVEVTGTNFTGTTTACTTSFDFGTTEVSVVPGSYHWVNAQQVDCQIEIIAAGAARYVIPTTSREGTNTTAQFDPNAAGSAQVDVWQTYTPVTDLADDNWSATTLAMAGDPGVNVYTTIVAAVDSVNDGSGRVIRVHEATYTPQLAGNDVIVIDDAKVNLVAVGNVVIMPDRAGGSFDYGVIGIETDNVIIDGFNLQNDDPRVNPPLFADIGILVRWGINFTIQNNTITGFGDTDEIYENSRGINTQAAGPGLIKDNILEANRTGIELSASDNVTISGNLVQNNRNGIALFNSDTALIIKNRVLTNRVGINLGDAAAAKVYTNDIVGNAVCGLYTGDANPDNDAKHNWWGAIGGPSAYDFNSAALGSGDAISQYAIYDPWLTEDQSTTVTAGIAYHGSTLELAPGWNTLSVPLKLKESANTLTEIAALGDFLTDTNWQTAYQYNPELTPEYGGWEDITELVPGRGYYIKTLEAVSFPVLYNGQLSLPTYDLTTTGWNLIGSMFGVESSGDYGIAAVDSTDGKMKVVLALDSIGANTSVVVSPYLPGQLKAFGVNSASEEYMQVGEAYWVFMEATDTLAGFEVTPIYETFLTR